MSSTILVIEDDPSTARLIKLQLSREGYSVTVAPNGFQGLKMAQAEVPDLILLDLMLPGMDGFEVLNRLRDNPQTADVKVSIVSAKPQATDKQMATRIGADAYLTKPYLPEDLLRLVRSLMDEQQEQTAPRGKCVILVAPQGGEAASVALHLGQVLVARGKSATAVDFRPFSIAHAQWLGVAPRPDLASLSSPKTASRLSGLTVQHNGGLHLLNNLEGSGDAGQFTADDVLTVLDGLLKRQDFILADVPLYPVDVLRQAANLCVKLLMVTRGDPASLGATRSALTMLERVEVNTERLGIVFVGPAPSAPEKANGLENAVLGALPEKVGSDDPAFQALAEHVLSLA